MGKELNPSVNELAKLKKDAVPNTVASTLEALSSYENYPNIQHLLSVLAVTPLTTCEAERNISCLRRLKTFMRSSMCVDRLTGLALMHIHKDMIVDIDQIIDMFARKHPRRMKLECILKD